MKKNKYKYSVTVLRKYVTNGVESDWSLPHIYYRSSKEGLMRETSLIGDDIKGMMKKIIRSGRQGQQILISFKVNNE